MSISPAVALFPVDEIPIILQRVIYHSQKLKKIDDKDREDSLSDRLFKMLRRDKMFRGAPYTPIREHQIFDDDCKEGHSGRIDINFVCPPGDQTYFAIESKRLHVDFASGWQSLVGEYVTGDQGMMCFISGKYSQSQEVAAMLGFVFDGEVDKARININEAIIKNKSLLKLAHPGKLLPSSVVNGRLVDETLHNLRPRQFTIYHMLISIL